MSLRPSEAQQAELCAYSVVLREKSTPTTSGAASFGKAFAACVSGDAEATRKALVHLSAAQADELLHLVETYQETMPVPAGAMDEWAFALNRSGGLCPWDDPDRATRGYIDHWWQEEGFYVVRDDKTGDRPVTHPADNLQLAPYLLAAGQVASFGAKPVGEVANPKIGRLVRYMYQPGEVEALWERFLRAEAKSRAVPVLAEPGGHCAECYQRMQCDVRLLPAMKNIETAMEPFMAGAAGLSRDNVATALCLVQAMSDVAERADEHLRAWVLENGPIVEGAKEWGPGETAGRESADLKLLKADGLTKYIKRGQPYQTFRWRNRKAPF